MSFVTSEYSLPHVSHLPLTQKIASSTAAVTHVGQIRLQSVKQQTFKNYTSRPMTWYCCGCCRADWKYEYPTCYKCGHQRCHKCAMITDNIAERRWNIRLKSEWEAEENYNFALYHTPDCRHKGDDDKCTCGGDNAKQKEFKNAVRVRKKEIRERNGKVAAAESKDQTEDQNKPDTPEKKEESGDEEFMAETPTKSRLKKGGGTPKGRGKTVTWAD